MNIFSKIVGFGQSEKLSDNINNKVQLSNILNLTLVFLIIAYTVISLIVSPPLVPYCLVGLGAYLLNIFISYTGLHVPTRLLTATLPSLVVAMLHSVILQTGDSVILEVYAFEIVAGLIPFAIFDYKRYELWIPTAVVSFLPVLFIYQLNDVFAVELDSSVFQTEWVRLSIILGAITMAGFIFIFMQRLNFKQFEKAQELTKTISEENKKSQEKELELKKSLEQLEEAQTEEKKRVWATTGLAEIGGLLREANELEKLTDAIIQYTVKYLEANQGAIYLLNDENKDDVHIELKSAYAFNRKKFINKRLEIGQGLVGQSYLEKDHIYLTEVPENYINITSGLGDAPPRSVLICPMIVNEVVYGAFEIASFNKFEEYQINFLMEMGENIAMTLNTFKVNEKTKTLLEETQEQSEQLRAQEEEMRQNMEELQATQEQQERQEKELRNKIEQLERENNELKQAAN